MSVVVDEVFAIDSSKGPEPYAEFLGWLVGALSEKRIQFSGDECAAAIIDKVMEAAYGAALDALGE